MLRFIQKNMHKSFILSAVALLVSATAGFAQGNVSLHQPAAMSELLAKKSDSQTITSDDAILAGGFRVQLYSSNNAYKAKKDAMGLEKELNNLYPDQRIYVSYAAPFWKVRIGDFTSYFDALTFSQRLKAAFPQYSNEIYIIKEDIVSISYY